MKEDSLSHLSSLRWYNGQGLLTIWKQIFFMIIFRLALTGVMVERQRIKRIIYHALYFQRFLHTSSEMLLSSRYQRIAEMRKGFTGRAFQTPIKLSFRYTFLKLCLLKKFWGLNQQKKFPFWVFIKKFFICIKLRYFHAAFVLSTATQRR